MVAEKSITFSLFCISNGGKPLMFFQMSACNIVYLAIITFERLKRFFIYCAAIRKLGNRCLGLASYRRVPVHQFDIYREWCRVHSTPKLTDPLVPLQQLSVIVLQFSLRKMVFFCSSKYLSKILDSNCSWCWLNILLSCSRKLRTRNVYWGCCSLWHR